MIIDGNINIYIEAVLIICLALQLYIFIGYPALILFLSKIFGKQIKSDGSYKPDISIIIAAHNEEDFIKDAIDSIYNSNYDSAKISVFVGSDGSTDKTVEILNELKEKYSSIYIYEFDRAGKNNVLNNLVPKTNTELVFFLDADLRLQSDSLDRSIELMADSDVGAVLSSLRIIDDTDADNTGSSGETIYQKYESMIRKNESAIKSTVNNLGTLYGIKRDVYSPLPNDLICDDFYNLLHTVISQKRVVFNNDSQVNEVRKKSLSGELTRRVRLVGGGLATLWTCKKILNPKYGWPSFFIFSHKLLRWMSPLILIIMLAGTILLDVNSLLWKPFMIGQGALYLLALIGWIGEKIKINIKILRIPLFFVSMNYGFLMGIIQFLSGKQNARWERTEVD